MLCVHICAFCQEGRAIECAQECEFRIADEIMARSKEIRALHRSGAEPSLIELNGAELLQLNAKYKELFHARYPGVSLDPNCGAC